jgi:hypothetical protein
LKGSAKSRGTMTDLSDHIVRRQLVARMQQDVDAFCRSEFAEDPRKHLGASVIGDDCQAKAWNAFRWLHHEEFDGRMLRLFNRGHEEEARFIRWLKGIGFEVYDLDPETKKQFRIRGAKGHFGGSLDSIIRATNYGIAEPLLGEFKTHNERSFTKLAGKPVTGGALRTGGEGVQKSKPTHYRQMCSYGRAYGFKYAVYCAVNKNTDELYFEIVVLDWRQADDLFRKAEGIIFSRTRPPKIAQVATYIDCKQCDFSDYCHGNAVPSKNCRSCQLGVPVDDGQWLCELRNLIIPDDVIPKGCPSWRRIA